ncbi:UDP-Glc:alpha-D-GlcNAc-diphosphoundecaprenol beta-1,3-glucosyltransferase WfgD [Acaryochloris thomasi RCC1774]|uniref:UDP-Glc:alpha-D-GlcNAc-diphosphoundecaprenol beta-1,3-glucosyltransferase WfgD n=1 Tax=Acaryochloris thomasi RCC1774 TaxID=1764569 RepID=A0A2W1JP77_9CYAN|nr:glycosyltransferase family A protein [Acaryochloris thomasi]PZD73235.1 UDP-Glc:alpha-D-GlcNAc-diphosphoundecaprenol beta-1,3-glucosyltransferase WfgD [Acaryochloris thomasi RCC1774]
MPKVSIIIPAYNSMVFLPETVECVLSQTFSDFELLIVNDGSSDNIIDWTAQQTDPRICLISQENRGAPIARNTGLEQAKGDYIAFLDSDDLWDSTKLEKQVLLLDKNPDIGVAYVWTRLMDRHGKPLDRVWASKASGHVWKRIAVQDNMIASGSVPLVRRDCFNVVGGFDPNLRGQQDWDMWVRLASKYRFGLIPEILSFHRHHQSSMSRSRSMNDTEKYSLEVIDKNFSSASPDLVHLKQKSYSYFRIAQGYSYVDNGEPRKALGSVGSAFSLYPKAAFSLYFLRLLFASLVTLLLGVGGYEKVRSYLHSIKLMALGIGS